MKKVFFVIFILITFLSNSFSNPVEIKFFNEFMIDENGWYLELHPSGYWDGPLDGWFLTSNTDTSYFVDGLYLSDSSYLVIDNSKLKSDLYINPMGDQIYLHPSESEGIIIDQLAFGDVDYPQISCPKPKQSLIRLEYHTPFGTNYSYCLDNTPTIGSENDTLDIKGFVDGYIKDKSGNPLKDVKVIYSFKEVYPYQIDTIYVLTNSEGHFKFKMYAQIIPFYLKKDNYKDSTIVLQVWPDSTVTIADVNLISGILERISSNIIKDFNLTQNFPNPFNNSTSFFYTLPEGNYINIKIYDEKGALVQKIFSGYQSAGKYKVNWNADNLASGVYIYQVSTGSFNLNKKAILLK